MTAAPITRTEKILLALAFIMAICGWLFYYFDLPLFYLYIQEDGLVEWLTVAGLLAAAFVCLRRGVKMRKSRTAGFVIFSILFGLVLFFGAGEEISWGQRLLGIQSPDYFRQNNAQGETNIHNLVLGGWRLNRWIFSILLSVVLFGYILLVPWLYKKRAWMQQLVNRLGVPLPKTYQVLSFLAIFLISEAIRDGKRAEILEAGTAVVLFLIIAFPLNRETFRSERIL